MDRNPGTVHSGVLCDIADAAMGIAYAANLNDGESFATLETQDKIFSGEQAQGR
jgi:acyl-coenzyme A thioesterase PaaI-like protein